MRRVVVTGMGTVSPFGRGVDYTWENIVAGKSAIRRIDGDMELYDVPVKIAGMVPMGKEPHQFDPDTVMPPKEQRRVDKFILFGMAAGIDAMEDSGYKPETEEEQFRAGVMMGSGIGGLQTIYENEGTEPRLRDRLFDGHPRHRRRGGDDCPRRCRRYVGGRCGIGG